MGAGRVAANDPIPEHHAGAEQPVPRIERGGHASLGALGPFITASPGFPAPTLATGGLSPQLDCFSAVGEATYVFNGTICEVGPATGAPSDAARYVLYRLDNSGTPVLSDSIGYVQASRAPINASSKSVGLAVVGDGVGVLSVSGVASESGGVGSISTTGFLDGARAPSPSLSINGQIGADNSCHTAAVQNSELQIEFTTTDSLTVGKGLKSLAFFRYSTAATVSWQPILPAV